MRTRPELLSPAGSLDKLKIAVLYGADAVYCGGQKFGLRMASDNFTNEELREGVAFAHAHGSKVYVVLNGFLHDEDLVSLPEFLHLLEAIKVDAVIVSDLGTIETVKANCNVPIHLSTQASCLNVESAKLWKSKGAERVVLGREVSLSDAKEIREKAEIEVEVFIHGSMCMAYSGNCTISNYTQGRDSNRGGCAHSCRFEYSIDYSNGENSKSTFMSSKDLEGVALLPQFVAAGVDSIKVEGRMKGPHYAGTITKIYADALRELETKDSLSPESLAYYDSELLKVTHRDYSTGSLSGAAGDESVYSEREHDEKEYEVSGVVADFVRDEFILLEVRHAFYIGDELELMPFKGRSQKFKADSVLNFINETREKTKPGELVKLPWVPGAEKLNLVRRRLC
ncbi:MAG: peptidase U32 [Halobacteriovorax sp.]|nr:peptidase U32 [Halobacteriovorax sp.]|tara:strand:- start:105800 stop:106990 length:1191 start_codon:yes stop_codon:yes gene_type:complete